jgi:hypothetical protein
MFTQPDSQDDRIPHGITWEVVGTNVGSGGICWVKTQPVGIRTTWSPPEPWCDTGHGAQTQGRLKIRQDLSQYYHMNHAIVTLARFSDISARNSCNRFLV